MGNNNSNRNVNPNIGQLTYPLSSFKKIKSFDIQKLYFYADDYVMKLIDGRFCFSTSSEIVIWNILKQKKDIIIKNDGTKKIAQLDNGKIVMVNQSYLLIISITEKEYTIEHKIKLTFEDIPNNRVTSILGMNDNKFLLDYNKSFFQIWKADNSYEVLFTSPMREKADLVIMFLKKNNIIFIGYTFSCLYEIWCPNTYQLITSMIMKCSITSKFLELDDKGRVLFECIRSLYIINIREGKILQIFSYERLDDINCYLPLSEGIILIGLKEGNICTYDINKNTIVDVRAMVHWKVQFMSFLDDDKILIYANQIGSIWKYK